MVHKKVIIVNNIFLGYILCGKSSVPYCFHGEAIVVRSFFGTKERSQVIKVVGIYAIFSLLWVYLSDSALELFVKDAATIARISMRCFHSTAAPLFGTAARPTSVASIPWSHR